MLWRREPRRDSAVAGPRTERIETTVRPAVNLNLSLRPELRRERFERVIERRLAPLPLLQRVERRTLIERANTERVETRLGERIVLTPRGDANRNERQIALERPGGDDALAPERRRRPNVAHAFDRLLVRRERLTEQESATRLVQRARRLEEAAGPAPLTLPKPSAAAAPAQEHAPSEAAPTAKREAMPAEWSAAIDTNRLADKVLREMDRRLLARRERFGKF